jgi:hypothetical protein
MANNYVLLTLDTTSPRLNIYAPSFTTRTARTPITIEADEPIAQQEIYLMDAEGTRHDVTFSRQNRILEGELYFDSFPLGMASLNVTLKDEVDNVSSLYTHNFHIVESEILTSEISLALMKHDMTLTMMNHELHIDTMKNEMAVTG